MKSNQEAAARTHLRLLAEELAAMTRQEARYISWASHYGVPTPEISRLTGVPVARVKHILARDAQSASAVDSAAEADAPDLHRSSGRKALRS